MTTTDDLRALLNDRAEAVDTDRPQRAAELRGRIRTTRRRRVAGGVAAAGLVAAVVVAAVSVSRTQDDSRPAVDQPTSTPTALTPARWGVLEPGRYTVPIKGAGAPGVVVDLPTKFIFDFGFGVFEKRVSPPAGRRGVGYWNGEELKVDSNFCAQGAQLQAPGPSVEDLAAALASQHGGFRTTDPVPVTLGGYDGLYLELSRPTNAPECPGDVLWVTGRWSPYHDYLDPGGVDRIWILNVDGNRLVIDAFNQPNVSADEVDELTRIVESTVITAP